NAANQVVSVGADIAFDADPKFFACLVRFESSSVPTTLPTAYDVYPLDGRHDGGYYTVKDCVTIDVLPRTPGNNVYVGFTKLSLLPKKLFRIRMSRNFGMKMLTMTNLSTECLIQLTKLGYDATPFNQILKQNAKREMRLRLGK